MTSSSRLPVLRATVTDDLETWATSWRELETRHEGRGLYASHGFVSHAWRHLRSDTDRLWIVRVDDDLGRLQGVLPLWLREERQFGVRLKVLLHPGILEGERPDLLAATDPDRVWSAAWAALLARRREWHRLELRETDAQAFALREAERMSVWQGWRAQASSDHAAPYWPARNTWTASGGPTSERTAVLPPGPDPSAWRLQVLTHPEDMACGVARYEALEAAMLAGAEAPIRAGTLQASPGAGDLYRHWLPELARIGRVQWAFAVDAQGRDLAGWLRLLEPNGARPALAGDSAASPQRSADGGGAAWLERHGAWRPDGSGPIHLHRLWWALQAAPWTDPDAESQCVHWPVPAGGHAGPDRAAPHDRFRETRRLRIWNLRSRVGPLLVAQQIVQRIQGRR